MNTNLFAPESENYEPQVSHSSDSTWLIVVLWILTLTVAGFIGFIYGKGNNSSQVVDKKMTYNATNVTSTSPTPVGSAASVATVLGVNDTNSITPTISSTVCAKTGFAQKWEYLTPYTIKDGDTVESIATAQLKDASRVNEILQINGVGPLVVGSTLYLPPSNIPKSSGNLKEVYGKLVEKNDTSWHVSFTADTSGQGVLMPSFLFQKLSNKDSFKIGDCIKIFFDDGYAVYSVALQ